MQRRTLAILGILLGGGLCAIGSLALSPPQVSAPVLATRVSEPPEPNQASHNCQQKGFALENRTGADGSQVGICVFPDGSECEEWTFLRGECQPGQPASSTENKAVEAARIALARQLNVDANYISVSALQQVRWPDSCLGIPGPREACQLTSTPGFRVFLTAGNEHFTYRTDLTGEIVRLETSTAYGG